MLAAPAAIWHLDEHLARYLECEAEPRDLGRKYHKGLLWEHRQRPLYLVIPRCSGSGHILSVVGSYCSFIWGNISAGFIVLFAIIPVFWCLDLFSSSGRLEYAKQGLISEWEEGPEE